MMASFMAKWSNHIRVSLATFICLCSTRAMVGRRFTMNRAHSDTQRYFIGGQQQLMPEMLVMVVDCQRLYRASARFLAPTRHQGVSRTTALRLITGSEVSQESNIALAPDEPLWRCRRLWHRIVRYCASDRARTHGGGQYHEQSQRIWRYPSRSRMRLSRGQSVARELFGADFVEHLRRPECGGRRKQKHVVIGSGAISRSYRCNPSAMDSAVKTLLKRIDAE